MIYTPLRDSANSDKDVEIFNKHKIFEFAAYSFHKTDIIVANH
jgi:hypothetical protein